MYMNRMIEVGKAVNGYVVECRVPFKSKADKKGMEPMCCSPCGDKQYIAKDAKEVGELIEKLMPLLEEDYADDKAFDKAFNTATESTEEEDD